MKSGKKEHGMVAWSAGLHCVLGLACDVEGYVWIGIGISD